MEFGRLLDLLVYGCDFSSLYHEENWIGKIVSEYHKNNFGIGFSDVGLDGYQL